MSITISEPTEVEEVKPNIFRLRLPMDNPYLPFAFAYLFKGEKGVSLVDAGEDTAEGMQVLEENLAKTGTKVTEIEKIVITHLHLDHYGLASKIRKASGAKIVYHDFEYEQYVEFQRIRASAARTSKPGAWMIMNGVPEEEIGSAELLRQRQRFMGPAPPEPDILVHEGEKVELGGGMYQTISTPGHSAGHMVMHSPDEGVVVSGDHILPIITPGVGGYSDINVTDPVGDFLASLGKVRPLKAQVVLPGHEFTFEGLALRVKQLEMHHEERFNQVMAGLQDGPLTAYEIAPKVAWKVGAWPDLDASTRQAAMRETASHLRHLEVLGRVSRVTKEGRFLYSLNKD